MSMLVLFCSLSLAVYLFLFYFCSFVSWLPVSGEIKMHDGSPVAVELWKLTSDQIQDGGRCQNYEWFKTLQLSRRFFDCVEMWCLWVHCIALHVAHCLICSLMHYRPRNYSSERLAPRRTPFKLQCITIATFTSFFFKFSFFFLLFWLLSASKRTSNSRIAYYHIIWHVNLA